MKICWDTLDKLKYKSHLGYWVGGKKQTTRYIYRDHCLNCGEPFLTQMTIPGQFCSIACGMLYSKGHKIKRPPAKNKTKPDPEGTRRRGINKRKAWVLELSKMRQLVCIQCGESAFECLDFHHRDPSKKNRSFVINKMFSYVPTPDRVQQVKEELNKCDILCSNCHRKEHHKIFLSKRIQ